MRDLLLSSVRTGEHETKVGRRIANPFRYGRRVRFTHTRAALARLSVEGYDRKMAPTNT
jgi:hypothetical protein